MNPVIRNILAVIAGAVIGSILNGGIISMSSIIIPPPPGVDLSNMESLKASIHLFEPKNFIMPFLAHALGTLLGAFITAKTAASNHFKLALVTGCLFLTGGIINVFLLPAPVWFCALDLTVAYIPMAYLGAKLARKN